MPRRFRSAASSRWRCSITCFARVASPYSLRSNRLVTLSHKHLLSVGCCFDIGRTVLGTARSGARSISVVHLSSSSLLLLAPFFPPFADDAVAAAEEAGRQRTTLCQQPSKCASTRAAGTCFTLVHSSCSCEDGLYRCTTPSTKKCGLPNQLWSSSFVRVIKTN